MVRARGRHRRYAIGGVALLGVVVVLVEVGAGGSRGLGGRAGPGSAPFVAALPAHDRFRFEVFLRDAGSISCCRGAIDR
jgi:hypothetical protein